MDMKLKPYQAKQVAVLIVSDLKSLQEDLHFACDVMDFDRYLYLRARERANKEILEKLLDPSSYQSIIKEIYSIHSLRIDDK